MNKLIKKFIAVGLTLTLAFSTMSPMAIKGYAATTSVTQPQQSQQVTQDETRDTVTVKGVKKFVTKFFIRKVSDVLRSKATQKLEQVVVEHFGESYFTNIMRYATPIADKLDDLYNYVEMPLMNFQSQLDTALQQCGASHAEATQVAWCITKLFDWFLF